MRSCVPAVMLATALLAGFMPLPGQEPQAPAPKSEPAAAKSQEPKTGTKSPKTKSAPKKGTPKAPPKSSASGKAFFGVPNPNAPLTPTPTTKVPIPSTKKLPKIPYEKRINLNGASREELMTLPTVDAATADKIIAGRPYKVSAELLLRNIVPGAHFYTIKGKVTAGKYTGPPKK